MFSIDFGVFQDDWLKRAKADLRRLFSVLEATGDLNRVGPVHRSQQNLGGPGG
jgi:hypothetical protein